VSTHTTVCLLRQNGLCNLKKSSWPVAILQITTLLQDASYGMLHTLVEHVGGQPKASGGPVPGQDIWAWPGFQRP